MGLLSKKDLQYTYEWKASGEDDPKITGKPDSAELNREEGYEVLHFINKFAEKKNFKQKASGLKTEKMIKEYLPGTIRSRINIIKWIVENWKIYD
jgi:hypothetical protein